MIKYHYQTEHIYTLILAIYTISKNQQYNCIDQNYYHIK